MNAIGWTARTGHTAIHADRVRSIQAVKDWAIDSEIRTRGPQGAKPSRIRDHSERGAWSHPVAGTAWCQEKASNSSENALPTVTIIPEILAGVR